MLRWCDVLVGGSSGTLARCALLVVKQTMYSIVALWHVVQSPSHRASESLHLRHYRRVSRCYTKHVRPVILTTRLRENENPEFRRRDRCRLRTGPSWESHLRLRRPWLCRCCGACSVFIKRCLSGALDALKTAKCSRLGGNEISGHVLEPQPQHLTICIFLPDSHTISFLRHNLERLR